MKKSIFLIANVFNEKDFIIAMLTSCINYIDGAYILDSASTDNTVELITAFFAEYQKPCTIEVIANNWRADHKRTYVMTKSKGMGDYRLYLDADNMLEVTDKNAFDNLTCDAYGLTKELGGNNYNVLLLFKSDFNFIFEGIIHEYPTNAHGEKQFAWDKLPGIKVYEASKGAGGRMRDLDKHYYDHALIIENELFYNDANLTDFLRCRYTFYLAQSYFDAGMHERAKEIYLQRTKMGGFNEEIYMSYLMIAKMSGNTDDYFAAWNNRPQRLEAAYELMRIFSQHNMLNVAGVIAQATRALPCHDLLWKDQRLYDGEFERLFNELFGKK